MADMTEAEENVEPPPPSVEPAELERLRRENALLHRRVARLEKETEAASALIAQAKALKLWDFTPYRVHPDDTWVAVDRQSASELLAALAGIDHWDPWHTRIEPRPQP
ncbi:hypothetical protein [Nocardioides psychrotolerans]|uniref:hypothetical protein n=1 Tax=Nocardioides psychrotolerans TaxID=1005945 RepID=UPI003137E8A6